ncbi:MAG: hypothetical protein AVDCRST_MAG30-2073 [uncultured Solirubrobacteraceae bacterium]|uniref:Uncharacterized protein n=1 Tax=uncultured Solirubrobacteraceae bacterium TaxID=1162706 RepID=A0A6J4SS23_9ACTN|nr:MAG: hypothetical protein AVDCRST_MAG30-2073 [uncultured Solirubrobacteraceae bacterium]
MELLRMRVDVMELQGGLATVVAAEHAAPAGLLDQHALDGPPALGHAIAAALLAPVRAAALEDVVGRAVVPATQRNRKRPCGDGSACGVAVVGLAARQTVTSEVPAHEPNRASEFEGHLGDRRSTSDEAFELMPIERRARPEAIGAVRPELVALEPVADCRWAATCLSGDRDD